MQGCAVTEAQPWLRDLGAVGRLTPGPWTPFPAPAAVPTSPPPKPRGGLRAGGRHGSAPTECWVGWVLSLLGHPQFGAHYLELLFGLWW